MKKKLNLNSIDLNRLDSKILVIVPNKDESILAAAIIIKDINALRDIERLDISVVFINNDSLDELKISPNIKKIYLIGIGPQNCHTTRIIRFINAYHDKIYFWANNCNNFNKEINSAVKKCSNLGGVIIGDNPLISHLLLKILITKNIPKKWLAAINALSNHKKTLPNDIAIRFRRAVYAAEVTTQYNNNFSLPAEIRKQLLNELLSDYSNKKINEMMELCLKIEEENWKIARSNLYRIKELVPGCGGLIVEKNIFDRNKIFGELLNQFKILAIQYQDSRGNFLTEICAEKHYQGKFKQIAQSLKNKNFKICIYKSKLSTKGNWKEIEKIIKQSLTE